MRNQLVEIASRKGGGGPSYGVKKQGDAQVAFIGFPSVGKSSLLNLLTEGHTKSRVASYNFTTLEPVPGMMEIEQAQIQLIDLPGIILGAAHGKGRGKEILSCVRSADLILIIICYKETGKIDFSDLETIRQELFNANIRLNEKPPRIQIKKRTRGGIGFHHIGKQMMDREDVKTILNELGYSNAAVYFGEPNITPDQLIDHVMGNRIYTPEFVVINKADLAKKNENEDYITDKIGHSHWIKISALKNHHIPQLQHQIFEELQLIRIYLKPPQQEADMDDPIVLPKDASLKTLCEQLHKTFVERFRYALVWGDSAKHPGQKFASLDHELKDQDIVSIYTRR